MLLQCLPACCHTPHRDGDVQILLPVALVMMSYHTNREVTNRHTIQDDSTVLKVNADMRGQGGILVRGNCLLRFILWRGV